MNSKNLQHRIENPSCGYPAASITDFIRGRPGAGRRPAARPGDPGPDRPEVNREGVAALLVERDVRTAYLGL